MNLAQFHQSGLEKLPELPPPPAAKIDRRSVIVFFVAVLIGGIVTYVTLRYGLRPTHRRLHFSAGQKFALLLGLFGTLYFSILIHELGHAVAGGIAGFRLQSLFIGPLWIFRRDRRLAVRFNSILQTWGGMAVSLPPRNTSRVLKKTAWMVAGGPLASLLLALFAGLAAFPLHGLPRFFALTLASTSAAIFCVTALVPGSAGKIKNDGTRIRGLLRNDARARDDEALVTLTGLALNDVPPREWPGEVVERVEASRLRGVYHAGGMMLVAHYRMSRAEGAAARASLAAAIEQAPVSSLVLPSLAVDAALFELLFRCDAEAAAPWIERAEKGSYVDQYRRHLIRALSARVKNDTARLAEEVRAAAAASRTARFGSSQFEREIIQTLEDETGLKV